MLKSMLREVENLSYDREKNGFVYMNRDYFCVSNQMTNLYLIMEGMLSTLLVFQNCPD